MFDTASRAFRRDGRSIAARAPGPARAAPGRRLFGPLSSWHSPSVSARPRRGSCRGPSSPPTDDPFSLVSRADDDGVVHRARFALPGDAPSASRQGFDVLDEDRRWVLWLLAGALVLAAVATTVGGADDDAGDVGVDPSPTDPGVGGPPPGTGGGPGGSDPGPGTGESTLPTVSRPGRDGLLPRQGVFLSVGTSRDAKRATGRTAGFDEDRDFLSLGYDRLLASTGNAGLALTLARADTVFDTSGDTRRQGSGTALLFAEHPFSATTRASAYLGAAVSDSESARTSDGSELQSTNGDGGVGGGGSDGSDESLLRGDTTVRTALAGVSFAHELAAFETVRTELRLNVDYARATTDAYEESGDPFLALGFDERVRESLGRPCRHRAHPRRRHRARRVPAATRRRLDSRIPRRRAARRRNAAAGPVLRQRHPRRRTRSGLRLGQPGADVPRERRAADLRGLRAGVRPRLPDLAHRQSRRTSRAPVTASREPRPPRPTGGRSHRS